MEIGFYDINTGSVLDRVGPSYPPSQKIPKGASVEYRTQDLGSELTKYSNINNTIFQDTESAKSYYESSRQGDMKEAFDVLRVLLYYADRRNFTHDELHA